MESFLEWNLNCSILGSNETALVEVAQAIEESLHITMDPKLDETKIEYS
jgi:hypothetical protein